MLRAALKRAGIKPAEVDYAELHAAGFRAGDLAEVESLSTVLCEERPQDQPCHIGALKGHIGHLEAAAGVASLIKVALCLWHRHWVPTGCIETLAPEIRSHDLNLIPQRVLEACPAGRPRPIATVTALSLGGANAFAVLEAADREETDDAVVVNGSTEVLLISARTEWAAMERALRYRDLLCSEAGAKRFHDICYASRERRTIWEHRIAVIGKCPEDVCHSLDQVLRNEPSLSAWVGHLPTQGPTHLDENHVSSQVLENERGLSDCCRDWAAGRPVDFSFLQITNAKNTTVPAYPFRRDVSLSLQDTHSMVRNQSSGENGGGQSLLN